MTPIFVASVEQMLSEILLQVYVHQQAEEARAASRLKAERALERLLSAGLPSARGPRGALLLDPYLTMNSLKHRRGESSDETWRDWVEASRVNATSLPALPHRYRLRLEREWRLGPLPTNRPVVLRLPLPIRGSLRGVPTLRVLEPHAALIERRDDDGRVELRLDPARVAGAARVELTLELVSGESLVVTEAAGSDADAELWKKPQEGLIAASAKIAALAESLPGGAEAPRTLAYAAFDRLTSILRLGDLHRDHLAATDPLGSLLDSAWVDCALAANLFVALCRTRGVPARMVSGFLLHRAFPAPHFWAEARLERGEWVPFDLGGWDYSEGDPADPTWGGFFRGRVDARFISEVAPRQFTGWGSARPPGRWFRLFEPYAGGVRHSLHELPSGQLFQADRLELELLGAERAGS